MTDDKVVLENNNMAKKTVGELLVETLVAAGVKRVFGLCGDSLNGITDCMRNAQRTSAPGSKHNSTNRITENPPKCLRSPKGEYQGLRRPDLNAGMTKLISAIGE